MDEMVVVPLGIGEDESSEFQIGEDDAVTVAVVDGLGRLAEEGARFGLAQSALGA